MDGFWILFWFLIGACTGSFLNVVIYRMPRGESIAFPGSHCPSCGRAIAWYDNIPLVSWLALRARCRHCKVHISSRYFWIELLTALLVVGLYVAYYMLRLRRGAGEFEATWPMFVAHMALLCGLLACSAVDIEHWIVPLEVCWFVAAVGVLASTLAPHPWMAPVAPPTGALAIGAVAGLAVSLILQHLGLLQPSFLDAQDKPLAEPAPPPKPRPETARRKKKGKSKGKDKTRQPKVREAPRPAPHVAATKADGVNPRREVLREVLFLTPPAIGALAAWVLVTQFGPLESAWSSWHRLATSRLGPHLMGFEAALYGYLIGGLWIWGTRILGTLAFGKEAMGLGDVHILAAVGAVTGWIVPSVAFFLAPFFALGWAIFLALRRRQRELPYGPWLAAASLTAMVAYDPILRWLTRQFSPLLDVRG